MKKICCICLNQIFIPFLSYKTYCCFNYFHRICIFKWVRIYKHFNCPICRDFLIL